MKKITVGLLSLALFLGLGSAVFAAGNGNTDIGNSFEKMLPFMQNMHPDSSKQELENMYKACHANKGMMSGTNKNIDSNSMMN